MGSNLGQKLSPILNEIHMTILEKQAYDPEPMGFNDRDMEAATHIFTAVLLDMAWKKGTSLAKVEMMGKELKKFVQDYTGIDLPKLVKKNLQ